VINVYVECELAEELDSVEADEKTEEEMRPSELDQEINL
jgi:hypothetical protein